MEHLGQYELLGVIGQGGMGRVYRARDSYGRVVALKVIALDGATDEQRAEYVKLFRREADLVTRMNSPHIVPIHGYGELDGTPYLDMRLVDGGSLSSVVRDYGTATVETALGILAQAAEALDDAHSAGVVHRDVKPANLLIDKRGFVYLADFGIAVVARHRGDGDRVLGSWPYMAPERFTGLDVGPESDIYSLGCVLHYALTGHSPFEGDGLDEQRDHHLHTPPPPLAGRVPGVTPRLETVINWALEKDPAKRPASAGEWIGHLQDAQREAGARPGGAARAAKANAPGPSRVLLGLLVVLVVVAAMLAAVALKQIS